MAQKVTGYIKLQIEAGKATPAPPVGPALGQKGVNIMAFTKEFNERTKNQMGYVIPVVITVYADRSFSFITKTPPAAVLIKKAAPLTVDFKVGDTVQITAGPLEGFMGLVEAIDTLNFKVKLKVNMFGRETPAEVEIGQVELP